MSDITTADFAGEGSSSGGFGACRSLLLDDDDYPVTCMKNNNISLSSFFASFPDVSWTGD
jgi:hypothetical protein